MGIKIVQLRHVISNKFLTLVPRSVADSDKECMKSTLSEHGSEASWFQITPRFKTRSEGGLVYFGDQTHFLSVKLSGYYLHYSSLTTLVDSPYYFSSDILAIVKSNVRQNKGSESKEGETESEGKDLDPEILGTWRFEVNVFTEPTSWRIIGFSESPNTTATLQVCYWGLLSEILKIFFFF